MEFLRYERVPAHLQADVISESQKEREAQE
jgi:hypothetical protein